MLFLKSLSICWGKKILESRQTAFQNLFPSQVEKEDDLERFGCPKGSSILVGVAWYWHWKRCPSLYASDLTQQLACAGYALAQ